MAGTRIEGIGVRVWKGDVQAAVDKAGTAYRERFHRAPSHVALPPGVDPSGLKLWTLNLAHPAGPGVVIVGREAGNAEL